MGWGELHGELLQLKVRGLWCNYIQLCWFQNICCNLYYFLGFIDSILNQKPNTECHFGKKNEGTMIVLNVTKPAISFEYPCWVLKVEAVEELDLRAVTP